MRKFTLIFLIFLIFLSGCHMINPMNYIKSGKAEGDKTVSKQIDPRSNNKKIKIRINASDESKAESLN